jgi:hypothetical protein
MGVRIPSSARSLSVLLLAGAVLLAPTTVASARQHSGDALAAAELDHALRPGDRVNVTLPDSTHVTGRFIQVSPELLAVETPDGRREIAVRDVLRVKRTRMGLVLGTAIGTGVGMLLGAIVAAIVNEEGSGSAAGAFLLYTGIGAATGCGIDAAINIPRTVYTRETPRVSVAPMVSPRGAGFGVRVSF